MYRYMKKMVNLLKSHNSLLDIQSKQTLIYSPHSLTPELTLVRVNVHEWYELTWVRFDICCVIRDVNSYHHLIPALLCTSWHHLWYELTSLVVRVDIYLWYELTWVRVDMGRVDMGTSWLSPVVAGSLDPCSWLSLSSHTFQTKLIPKLV